MKKQQILPEQEVTGTSLPPPSSPVRRNLEQTQPLQESHLDVVEELKDGVDVLFYEETLQCLLDCHQIDDRHIQAGGTRGAFQHGFNRTQSVLGTSSVV